MRHRRTLSPIRAHAPNRFPFQEEARLFDTASEKGRNYPDVKQLQSFTPVRSEMCVEANIIFNHVPGLCKFEKLTFSGSATFPSQHKLQSFPQLRNLIALKWKRRQSCHDTGKSLSLAETCRQFRILDEDVVLKGDTSDKRVTRKLLESWRQ